MSYKSMKKGKGLLKEIVQGRLIWL